MHALGEAERSRLAAIAERLATLGTSFGQNVLHDEKEFLLVLAGEDDLAGLPPALRDASAQAAAERGLPGQHVVTLGRSLIEPFLRYATRRDLRQKAFEAWTSRGEHEGLHDNRPIVAEMVRLRAERAHLLGFENYAHLKLDDTMAKTPEAVRGLLDPRVGQGAATRAARDAETLQALMHQEGQNAPLAAHDCAPLRREGAAARLRSRRERGQILPRARRCGGRGIRHRHEALRRHLRRTATTCRSIITTCTPTR